MIIGVDYDNTIVEEGRNYEDYTSPPRFLPGAKEGVLSLKKAGHTLVLWSARASPNLITAPDATGAVLDPEFKRVSLATFKARLKVNRGRYDQMLSFIRKEFPGVFSMVTSDKHAIQIFIDDKALRLGPGPSGLTWAEISHIYGEPDYSAFPRRRTA